MALSEREQQVLRDLEEQLSQDDPSLATQLNNAEKRLDKQMVFSPRRVGAGVALVLVGLVVLIAGVTLGHAVASIVVGVIGFALAVWGVTLMVTRVDRSKAGPGAGKSSSAVSGAGKAGKPGKSAKPGFMDRQADRWERRRDERP